MTNLPLEDSPQDLDKYGPIFILGCPRSGTTFLSDCISLFNGVEEFVGVIAPPRLLHLIAYLENQKIKQDILSSVRDIFWQSFWRRRYFSNQRLIQLINRKIGLVEFLQRPSLKDSYFLYKEPFLCFASTEFAEHFKNGLFIHIIRDGRDNADSFERKYPHALSDEVLQNEQLAENKISEIGIWRKHNGFIVPWWVEDGIEEIFIKYSRYERCVYLWKVMTERALSLRDEKYKGRYLEIKYEDFVSAPLENMKIISDFIGKDINSKIRSVIKKSYKTSINISQHNQDTNKIKLANQIAGNLLNSLGYSL